MPGPKPCNDCASLVLRVTNWSARHAASPRGYDVGSLLRGHRRLDRLGIVHQNPEGRAVLLRCGSCGTFWVLHEWTQINDVNIEQADDAVMRRFERSMQQRSSIPPEWVERLVAIRAFTSAADLATAHPPPHKITSAG